MKRFTLVIALTFTCVALSSAQTSAQQPTNANIRCYNTSTNQFVACPMQDGGSGPVTANTGRITIAGEPCSGTKTPFSVSINSATTTQLISASAGNKAYICSLHIGPIGATANNLAFVEDDSAGNCPSPTAGLSGGTTAAAGMQFIASQGSVDGGSNAAIMITPNANRYVCVITSSASVTPIWGTYVLAP